MESTSLSEIEEFNKSNISSTDISEMSNREQEHLKFRDDCEKGQYITKILREWVQDAGLILVRRIDSLLTQFDKVFPNVAVSYKTLLHTPSNVIVKTIMNSNLWYKGIGVNLNSMNLEQYQDHYKEIVMDINIDGLPLFHSGIDKFWPLLGKVVGLVNEPIVIAIFKGKQNPSMNDLLEDFVVEVANLCNNGFLYHNINYNFSMRNYILDAPARSKVKFCVKHGGYFACEKCEVRCEYIDNRMTYAKLNATFRTD
ncbi:uncharacterized protein [Prorops nasuta]|uniref:uncharacterized protein n=1 Tax=Prorops nasuta TaxID=863751 RepID=UPI0034CD1FE8